MKTEQIVYIPIEKLISCDTQPINRIKKAGSGSSLADCIKVAGCVPIVVVENHDDTYTIADGHRRLAAMTANGEKRMPCTVNKSGLTAEELMAILNSTSRSFSCSDHFKAWAMSSHKSQFLTALKDAKSVSYKHITSMVDMFGVHRAAELSLYGVNPALYVLTNRISASAKSAIQTSKSQRAAKVKLPTTRQIGEWIVYHRATGIMGTWAKLDAVSTKTRGRLKLIERILANEPFPPNEWDN
jgi:hypothetical protein